MDYNSRQYAVNTYGQPQEPHKSKVNYKKLRYLSQFALDKGAQHTKIISVKTIIVSQWNSLKCRYNCVNYGKSNVCPPDSPPNDRIRSIINSYEKAILIQGNDKVLLTNVAVETEKEAFYSGCYKAFAFGTGPCKLKHDIDPFEEYKGAAPQRPLLDAVGIDSFQTARNNGFRIDVLYSPDIKPNYISLVLVE